MQMVRRRVVVIAFSLALLAFVSSGGSGRAATDATAPVVVVTSAVVPEEEGLGSGEYRYAEYGLVLRNQSSSRDAIDVTVEVEALDGRGESLTDGYSAITLIPAGADFVVSGALIYRSSLELADFETEIHVGQTAPRGRRLPSVKRASVTSSRSVVGSFRNPYKRPLPASATIYGVLLDRQGRIVATGYDFTDAVTRPRATVAFDLRSSTTVQLEAATSAKVSVDPCGYLAFTRACPVTGAQR